MDVITNKYIAIIMLIATICVKHAYSYTLSSEKQLECISYVGGEKYTLKVTKQMLEPLPKWHPSISNTPPVTCEEAFKKAKSHMQAYIGTNDLLQIDSIRLQNLHDGDWAYIIKYYPSLRERAGPQKGPIEYDKWSGEGTCYYLIVLMDGEVVSERGSGERRGEIGKCAAPKQ